MGGKFKFEQVESTDAPRSWVLEFLRRSRGVAYFRKRAVRPLREQMVHYFAGRGEASVQPAAEGDAAMWGWRVAALALLGAIGYASGSGRDDSCRPACRRNCKRLGWACWRRFCA